ncbi:MAG: cell division protein FtsL [Methylococcaceae bacterium]|nr:cell division protein FtsL [Methylococcaceae bacterium]
MIFIRNISLALLWLVLLASSVLAIYYKYETRLLFIELQKMERDLDGYEIEWGQLQLELTTLTEQNRIEQFANKKLKLVMPIRDQIIYIKP